MVGILVSFWDGLFSGAVLFLGRVHLPLPPGPKMANKVREGTKVAKAKAEEWMPPRLLPKPQQLGLFQMVDLTGIFLVQKWLANYLVLFFWDDIHIWSQNPAYIGLDAWSLGVRGERLLRWAVLMMICLPVPTSKEEGYPIWTVKIR